MKTRTRRFLLNGAIVVAVLFVGRWAAEFLAERWWAATISDAALSAVTRWWLLGLGLDIGAIVLASCWFMLQALAIARTVTAIHITRHIGNLEVREAVPTRFLLWGAIVVGVLLGWISGAGADSWRGPVALAWQGVHWGAKDPLLNSDLGVFITRLPVWEIAHDFLLTLIVVGLAFTFTLYAAIGAIRREERHLQLNPLARRHLAGLLALLALTVAIGFLLTPWELAASQDLGGSLPNAKLQINSSHWFAAMAVVTLILTLMWGGGRRAVLLFAGWAALLTTLLAETFVLPSRAIPAQDAKEIASLQTQFSMLAWSIPSFSTIALSDSLPPVTAIWDERVLRRSEGSKAHLLLAATPSSWQDPQQGAVPVWLVAALDTSGKQIQIRGIEEGRTSTDGTPLVSPFLLHHVDAPRTWPGAPSWRQSTDGITVKNPLSRMVIAWARQAGGVLSLTDQAKVDWHLDPAERAAAVLPMAHWLPPDLMLDGDHPIWVTQGLIPVVYFPLSFHWSLSGEEYAGLLPAYIALVDMATGQTRVYFDPAAGPVAKSWAGFAPGLIAPATSLPTVIRDRLPYAATWADIQFEILHKSNSQLNRSGGTVSPLPVWLDAARPALQEVMIGNQIITARRNNGLPEWTLDQDNLRGTSYREPLVDAFRELPLMMHLVDSVRASGDSTMLGALRWWHGTGLPVVWQPIFSADRTLGPRLIGVATERRHIATLSRSLAAVWSAINSSGRGEEDSLTKNATIVTQARRLMLLADSALKRGDLTAFGRYFESLQRVLAGGKP